MTDLDARLAALSPEKRALFEKLLRERGQARPARRENVFPISVMQQGIWFLEQLRPGNPAYLIPAAVRIARAPRRIIRQNLGWALGYNLLAIPLAASGVVTPWIAALGMAGSSLVVTLNALRLARLR